MAKEAQSQEALLFQVALGIQEPWYITDIDLKQDDHELHIYLNFERGSEFPCPTCKALCKCHDTKSKVWQHLTFFQYKTYIHARLPRVSCDDHGVHLVEVPWARQGTGFSLLMEAFMLTLCKETTRFPTLPFTSLKIRIFPFLVPSNHKIVRSFFQLHQMFLGLNSPKAPARFQQTL